MLLCMFAVLVLSATASVVYNITTDEISIEEVQGFKTVKSRMGQTWGNPGEPNLSWIGVKLLLPLQQEASEVLVNRSNPVTYMLDKPIAPIQNQYPLSQKQIMPRDLPDQRIYSSDSIFPTQAHNGLRTEYLAGHPIAFTAICPFDYNPVRGELIYYRNISVEIRTQSSAKAVEAMSLLKQDAFISSYLSRSIDNQDALPTYTNRTDGYEYIIVIDQAKYNQWLPLKDFYEDRGYMVLLKSVQEIIAQNTGVDNQQKIRNYFINMYASNSLRHVLLAADSDVIPHRGLYVNFPGGGQVDADIPADMYYSCLDGTWNNDNDTYWGETYEADFIPEFSIGRFCYNNDTDISNFLNKVMMYQIAPVSASIKSAAFVGEYLWDGPTWGGDYMDEMIGGSTANGYSTVGVPSTWNISTLYDRTYGYENGWGGTQIRALLSAGNNFVNHLGHSNTTYNMRLSNNGVTASTITNNGSAQNYSIYFTQGCYAGAFDNRDTAVGDYVGDCITEKFTSIATSAAGMISHSRYGWGMQGSTDGASQYLHRQYNDAIFGEEIMELGYTLVDCKVDNIPYITNSAVMYWVTYETNLIGDPAMTVWTDTPQTITAQLPSVWAAGVNNYQIQTNAPHASFRIFREGAIVFESSANENGLVDVLLDQALSPGQYTIYMNKPNFYAYQTNFSVEVLEMPYIVCYDINPVDDDALLHGGETISLAFTMENVGPLPLTQAGTLVLSSPSNHINITQNTINFDPMTSGAIVPVSSSFSIELNNNFTDGAIVPLTLTASFGTYTTQSSANLVLNAPTLSINNYQINNVANLVMPGHSPQISFTMHNSGSGYAYTPMILLMPEDPMLSISTYEILLPQIEPSEDLTISNAFTVNVSPDAEIGSTIRINYYLMGENGTGSEGNFEFTIGVMAYTFENDLQNWTTEAPNPQFVNQWHRSNARNNTANGGFSVKFGGSGSGQYANSAYGALISPAMALGQNSQFKFYHWIDAEIHATSTGMAWDGGMVQISVNDGAWVQIIPVGGYPYRIYSNPASPFTANTYVYSGTVAWQEATFDLSSYSGSARFRFLFGSDGSSTGEGWYIDDVRLESDYVGIDEQTAIPSVYSLSNYPNPFNPNTRISFSLPENSKISLEIYNVKGQRVKTLVNRTDYQAGNHNIQWDGKDDNGSSIASGVYFYKLQSTHKTLVNKMLLMK